MADPFVQKFEELNYAEKLYFPYKGSTSYMGSNEEVDPGSREDFNEGGVTSDSYQSFACHDGGGDMSGNRCIGK